MTDQEREVVTSPDTYFMNMGIPKQKADIPFNLLDIPNSRLRKRLANRNTAIRVSASRVSA